MAGDRLITRRVARWIDERTGSAKFARTALGKALLATSMNKDAASLMGIKTGAILMMAFGISAVIGAAAVWVPAALYLLLSGEIVRGLILLATGILIISLVDNLLRPPLVGKGARMPDYLILVSTLGGIALMGVNGFVVGPLIAALFVTVWSMMSDSDSWQ